MLDVICNTMKIRLTYRLFLFLLCWTPCLSSGQTNIKSTIKTEISRIKNIPSYSHPDIQGKIDSLIIIDSSFSKIVSLGTSAIPVLIDWLYDTSFTIVQNPCWLEEPMRTHDIAWFLINEIEPIPEYPALKIKFCTYGDCSHFPEHFFNYIHTNPKRYANRYKKYFTSKERKIRLQENIYKTN